MAWLTGWTYRKAVTIKRADGAVSNYQMKLLLGESDGASGEYVDCGGKCLSSFNDIRFTKSDGTTLLDYWIESLSGATPNQLATVWIEFDSIGTGSTTFYMYYGKADAPSVSSGVNTFLFFDDFELNNFSRWTTAQAQWSTQSTIKKMGTYAAYGQGAAANRILGKDQLFTDEFVIHFWLRANATALYVFYGCLYQGSLKYLLALGGNDGGAVQYYDGVYKNFSPALSHVADTWYEVALHVDLPNNRYRMDWNGKTVAAVSTVLSTSDVTQFLNYCSSVAGRNVYLDDVYIRKWAVPEPLWGDWGGFDYVGHHWEFDGVLYTNGNKSAKCLTYFEDEDFDLRVTGKTVSWGSIKMVGKFRTNLTNGSCQTGCYYPLVSNSERIQPIEFRDGHFQHYDVVGGHQNFPNDKTFLINNWYTWEVIFDFENSLQKTTVDEVDLGDIVLKDIAGNTLNGSHTVTNFDFIGSSATPVTQFNIDEISVYSYPANVPLFSVDFEEGWGNEEEEVTTVSHVYPTHFRL